MAANQRWNEKFIDLMEQLSSIMLKQGEPFRARAYQKAQETIMAFPGDITSTGELKGQPGIGETITEKLNEYVSTGTLKVLEREKNNPVNVLAEVYGIGPKKSKELVDAGITTIQELRSKQDQYLNDVQKVGLKYYEDILKRIPRSEIVDYEAVFKKYFINDSSHFSIVGSYRRGAESSGDIDVIITSENPKNFVDFIDALVQKKVIVEILSRGPTKCLVIAKIPSSDSYRRVDFLYTNKEEYPFSILYFTGSKIFNTVMRHQALTMGLTMNEHGLYTMEKGKKKGDKVDLLFTSEKDIFDYLHMEYKAPHERTDGRAVMIEEDSESVSESDLDLVLISEFKKKGISVLGNADEKTLVDLLRQANQAYYNAFSPIMTDHEFDILREFIQSKYPANPAVLEVGAPVLMHSRNPKVSLPYEMPSMDKIKPDTNALVGWKQKYGGPYVVSCKLDGVSGLYTMNESGFAKLYTRGDGKIGQDISHLIPYLRLPKSLGLGTGFAIRGEFIVNKKIFQEKYASEFANPRNMVAGIINHKGVDPKVKDLCFVAYEVIQPVLKPSEQMNVLKSLEKVECVLHMNMLELTNEKLSSLLIDWRVNYAYEIDGVIVTNDQVYPRKSGNPEHAFAFKMVLSDQVAEAKVVDVLWTPSKDGYLKPRVQIEPISLGGVRIEYATGFNGAFIQDQKIGVGAVIELIRSGDVIPYIRKVIVPAETGGKMPSVSYVWNDTHVDVLLEQEYMDTDETVREKMITGFFRGIGVEGLSSGNVARIIQAGFTSVPDILAMKKEDFLKVEGFQTKMATKIYEGIVEKVTSASLVTLMAASNLLGRGFSEKKIELIMEGVPDLLISKKSPAEKVEQVKSLKGMADKSAEAFVFKIPEFIEFLKRSGLESKVLSKNSSAFSSCDCTHLLYGKTIVMTGFRDKSLDEFLKKVGAKMGSSVSKNTFLVLVKDLEEETGKILDAKKIGIPIVSMNEFQKKYL